MANQIRKSDVADADFLDASELASDGSSVYLTTTFVSTDSDTRTVVIEPLSDGTGILNRDHPAEPGDIVVMPGLVADGGAWGGDGFGDGGSSSGGSVTTFAVSTGDRYTIEQVLTDTSFRVLESIVSSTRGGPITFHYVPGAKRIGLDPVGLFSVASADVQSAIEELDAAVTLGGGGPHGLTHENGGEDEIVVTGLSGRLADPQLIGVSSGGTLVGTQPLVNLIQGAGATVSVADNPGAGRVDVTIGATGGGSAAHATSHQDGGSDELLVTGLSGRLADPQLVEVASAGTVAGTRTRVNLIAGSGATINVVDNPGASRVDVTVGATGVPAAHASTHADAGSDELNVTALSGRLADPQLIDVARQGTLVGTRSKVNLIPGTGGSVTVVDNPGAGSVDVTIGASGGAPGAHAASHQDGGADEISVTGLSGLLADPQTAGGIKTATTVVDVATAAAPSVGQALVAVSSTAAAWTTPLQLTSTAPSQVSVTTADAGAAADAARRDHTHSVSTATPVALTVGGANTAGVATTLVRSDHAHALPAFGTTAGTFTEGNDARIVTPVVHATRHQDGGADEISVAGLSGVLADPQAADKIVETGGPTTMSVVAIPASGIMRRNTASQVVGGPVLMDNSGNISAAGTYNGINLTSATAPSALAVGSVQAAGTATTISRSDHVHGMPGLATTSVDGFMPATGMTKLAGIAAGADVTLTALSTAGTDIAVNSKKITGLADPTNAQDACTKGYADAVTQGLDVKTSCRVIATGNITLSGTQTIDGVPVIVGNRVLCAGQTAGETNGIYVVAAGAWTRATDADASAEVTSGVFTFVVEGTLNADSGWVLITVDPIVLGTTPLVFTQFSGAGQIQAGAGLTKTGNTLNVGANADGSIVVAADDIRVGVISNTQHGSRGGGTQHSVATSSVDGFMLAADKVKLDGVADNAAALTVAGTPTQISVVTAAVGSGTVAARNDHLHSVATSAPIALSVGGANAAGTATTLVRSDHVHGMPAAGAPAALAIGSTQLTGVASTLALSDHVHEMPGAAPAVALAPGGANAAGAATTFARSDHTHGLPAFGTTAGTFCEGNDARLTDLAADSAVVFVDSVRGSDANDGTTTATPYKTLARAKQDPLLLIAGTQVMLASSSRFREELSGWPVGVKVGAYGTGARPIIDGRDIASNASFSKTAGQTNVYQISWTHGFAADGGKSAHRVWEASVQMIRAASLAACDTTPGSFFAAAPTTGGPDLIYIHPTGDTAPLLEYAITKRRWAIQLYDAYNQANVTGLEAIGNSFADGSLCIDGYAEDCVARDGRVHNAFILGTAVNCQAIGIEPGILGTLFVSYYDSGPTFGGPATRDIVYRGCVADTQRSATEAVGFFVHTNNDGRVFGTVQFESCRAVGCSGGWGGSAATVFLCYLCSYDDVTFVYDLAPTTIALMLGGAGRLRNAVNSKLFNFGMPGVTFRAHGLKCYGAAGGVGPLGTVPAAVGANILVDRCTVVAMGGGWVQYAAGNLTVRRSIVAYGHITSAFIGQSGAQIGLYLGDRNCYWASSTGQGRAGKAFGGQVFYENLTDWRTYLASVGFSELATIAVDPQVANPAALDFTVGNAQVRALGAGAEPDEENDPELQAYWAQYRIAEPYNAVNVAAHASRHQDGGADEINVTGLKGRLADPQTADGIGTATTVVSVAASTAPTAGQTLIAISTTAAAWTTPLQLTVAGTPTQISVVAAAVGSGTVAARNDHLHSVATATPISLAVGGANAPGTATTLVRSDHVHGLPSFGTTSGTFCEGNDARLSAALVNPAVNGFRLAPTADDSAADGTFGTIHLAPVQGDIIALNTGGVWALRQTSGVSYTLAGRTTDLPFDLFAWWDTSGTPVVKLEVVNWSSGTPGSSSRATGLTRVNGVWTKTGDPTRRYLGTCRPRTATTYKLHFSAALADNNPPALDLWNVDNRRQIALETSGPASGYGYSTSAWRAVANSGNARIDIVVGLSGDSMSLEALSSMYSNNASTVGVGIGIALNQSSAPNFSKGGADAVGSSNGNITIITSRQTTNPNLGVSTFWWLENGNAGASFGGNDTGAPAMQGLFWG